MPDNQIIITAITVFGAIITTYLTVRYKDGLKKKNIAKAPKDRMEAIFDGYDSLIRELKDDSDRKGRIIDNLQIIIDNQRAEIEKSQGLINKLQDEVTLSTTHADELKTQLDAMKKDYASGKTV